MQADNELISIIVPVYNASKVLERCVSSICNQDYKNIEIILVNDGSKDNSLEIANKLASKDNRIKVITQENGGVSSARNTGIKNSKGTYIGFVDADDWIGKNMYSSMYSTLKQKESDLVLCNYTQVYDKKFVKRDEFIDIDKSSHRLKELILTHIISRRENNIMGTCWRMLVSKEILINHNIDFDLGVRMSEDMMFMIKCVDKSQRVTLDSIDEYYYWMNQNSATAKYIPNIWEDMMILIDWCNQNLYNSYTEIDLEYYLSECIVNAIIVATSNSCKNNTPMKFIERLKYCKELVNKPYVKNSLKMTWKNKRSFPHKYWPQVICVALRLRWIVVLYHSLKHRTIFNKKYI